MADIKALLEKYPSFDAKGNRVGKPEPSGDGSTVDHKKPKVRRTRKPAVSNVATATEAQEPQAE